MQAVLKIALLIVVLVCASAAQEKRNPRAVPGPSPSSVTAAQPNLTATPEPTPEKTGKKNDRPANSNSKKRPDQPFVPTYFYEFEREGFVYSYLRIEHDASGRGKIAFRRDGYQEELEDPISLSAETMEQLNGAFDRLKFLDSSDDYQTKMDHSNMGNVTIRLKREGKERTAKFNWTLNPDAKFLMDEYRRIANEYTWRFEIISARSNQPLLAPGIIEGLDSYIQRGEISDPPHLLPFLKELSSDERLPLMARNRALKIIKGIEKSAKK